MTFEDETKFSEFFVTENGKQVFDEDWFFWHVLKNRSFTEGFLFTAHESFVTLMDTLHGMSRTPDCISGYINTDNGFDRDGERAGYFCAFLLGNTTGEKGHWLINTYGFGECINARFRALLPDTEILLDESHRFNESDSIKVEELSKQ